MNLFASNYLSKVEPVASELENTADHMEAAGIGGHPTRGHAVLAREMAADIRANAAKGVLSAAFDRLYSAADVHAASAHRSSAESVDRALSSIAGMNASVRRAVVDALTAKGVINAAAEFNGGRNTIKKLAANASNTSRLKMIRAEAARLGVALADDEPINLVELDAKLQGKDLEARWRLKTALRQIGLLS
jgi:hypothetical protein